MSLAIPALLVIAALVAFCLARGHYQSGMTGDAIRMIVFSLIYLILAASYLLGYGVAKWLS